MKLPGRTRRRVHSQRESSRASKYDHDAFISYSYAWDNRVAEQFQRQLQRFAKPPFRPGGLRVFLDKTNLGASAQLWPDIERALSRSRWLILMASPKASTSSWVCREIQWWLEHRSAETILIAVTDGHVAWDDAAGTFDWAVTDALPRDLLRDAFCHEPRWVDLRWLHESEQISRSNPRLAACVLDFVAPIRNMSKDQLAGEYVRQRRQARMAVTGVVTALAVLLALAVTGGVVAFLQRDRAQAEAGFATSRQLAAEASAIGDSQPDLARQLLAQAYRFSPTSQVTGAIYRSPELPRATSTPAQPHAMAFDASGLLAVGVGADVILYGSDRSAEPVKISGSSGAVTALAFGANDRLLVVGRDTGDLQLFDVPSGAPRGGPRTQTPTPRAALRVAESIYDLSFGSGTGRLVVLSSNPPITVLDISDPGAPRIVGTPLGTTAGDHILAMSHDGTRAFGLDLAGTDKTANVWQLSGVAASHALDGLYSSALGDCNSGAFSPDGQLLAVGGASTALLLDVADAGNPRQLATLSGGLGLVTSIAFSAQGTTLALGGQNGTIQLWDVSDPRRPSPGSTLAGHTGYVATLVFSRDGRTIASGSEQLTEERTEKARNRSSAQPGVVRMWSVEGAVRSSAAALISGFAASAPAFTPDGRLLVTDAPATLWDVADPRYPRSGAGIATSPKGAHAVAISPDGRVLATGAPVVTWDISDRAHPAPLSGTATTISSPVQAARFSPDGTLLALGPTSQEVQLWDMKNPRQPRLLTALQGSLTDTQSVAFGRDAGLIATVEVGGAAQIWDIAAPQHPRLRTTVRPPGGRVTSLTFGQDGKALIAGTSQGAIVTWDVSDPRHATRLGSATRHVDSVKGLALQPGANTVATTSNDGSVRLWDLSDMTRPAELTSLQIEGWIDWPVPAFSPDGRILAVGSNRGVRLWDVAVPDILARLCAESTPITRAQWAQYLPHQTYDPPCA